jgi:hypothetical protein
MKEDIGINQAKVGANLKEMKEEMMARLEALIQANHKKMMAKLDSHGIPDGCQFRKDGGHGFGGKSRRIEVHSGASGSP